MEGLARYCIGEASLAGRGAGRPGPARMVGSRARQSRELPRRPDVAHRARPSRRSVRYRVGTDVLLGLIRGHGAEGLWRDHETRKLPSLPPATESRALVGAAAMCYTQAKLSRARTALTRAALLAHDSGDVELVVIAKHRVRVCRIRRWKCRRGPRLFYPGSVAGSQALATPWCLGNALYGMAAIALTTGDAGHWERLLDQATSALRHAGPWFLAATLYVGAILAVRRGSPDEAIAMVRECLTRIRDLQDKFQVVSVLDVLAAAAALKGDDDWTARIWGPGPPFLNAEGSPMSTRQCRGSESKWNATCAYASARIGGQRPTLPAASPPSMH